MELLKHWLGMDNANGEHYLFWSGSGGDLLTMLPIAWGVYLWYKHNKCHYCYRLGHHVPHLHWPVCKGYQKRHAVATQQVPTVIYDNAPGDMQQIAGEPRQT